MNLVYALLFFFFIETFGVKEPISPIYTAGRTKTVRDLTSHDTCFLEAADCDPEFKYRTHDGSCNSLEHPTWGMTNTAYLRLFEAIYSDGIELPPVAKDGSELPNAREIVLAVLPEKDVPDIISLIEAQWGQFVAHDSAITSTKAGVADCCASDDPLLCININIPEGDSFYEQFDVTCLPVTRTQTTQCGDCSPEGQMWPINGVTHAFDASQIYGSSDEVADSIREHVGGRLATRILEDGRHFLPSSGQGSCYNSNVCYVAGEVRVNQNPQLTILHVLATRAHNKVAEALAIAQPDWDDETLYQESRRVVTAMYAHITYNEFLPNLLPEEVMVKNKLRSRTTGYYQYDPEIPDIVFVSFSTAYRYFHSALQGVLQMYDYHFDPIGGINITDYMNSPGVLEEENNFDELILGLVTQPMQALDNFYAAQLEGQLFHAANPYGTDLSALDIQRGRDLAVPGYTTILYGCTGIEVTDFEGLNDLWPPETIEQIRQLYTSVDDIDLWVGLNFENTVEGHKISPVFECLLAEQFYRWKNSDRFWYENEGQPSSFTPEQLAELRKITLSRVICDASDNIVNISANSWRPPSDDNPVVSCDDIPAIDWTPWA